MPLTKRAPSMNTLIVVGGNRPQVEHYSPQGGHGVPQVVGSTLQVHREQVRSRGGVHSWCTIGSTIVSPRVRGGAMPQAHQGQARQGREGPAGEAEAAPAARGCCRFLCGGIGIHLHQSKTTSSRGCFLPRQRLSPAPEPRAGVPAPATAPAPAPASVGALGAAPGAVPPAVPGSPLGPSPPSGSSTPQWVQHQEGGSMDKHWHRQG